VIEKIASHGRFVMAMIRYPDCTNYEGRKIVLFENVTEDQVKKLDFIDPHFCNAGHVSPIARYVPTDQGWNRGMKMMQLLAMVEG
jgi:hypothetical protein